MTDRDLSAMYGLKYNPFQQQLPVEDLWPTPGLDTFLLKLRMLLRTGGFALITGEPGLGKSKLLHQLAHRFEDLDEAVVGVMQRPQSTTSDFYRELGDVFGVNLAPANRYGSFKALRDRFRSHMKTTLLRPLLLIDDAQEARSYCLTELRILGSADFDSQSLLTVVLCGDERLPNRFRGADLLSFGTRIRARLQLKPWGPKVLMGFLDHALAKAGAPQLMSEGLRQALCEQCAGNLRLLAHLASDVLTHGVRHKLKVLDEGTFFEALGLSSQPMAGAPR